MNTLVAISLTRHAELVSASIVPRSLEPAALARPFGWVAQEPMAPCQIEKWTLEAKLCLHKQVQGDETGGMGA